MTRTTLFSFFFILLAAFSEAATITTDQANYAPGEVITVTFSEATSSTDWIGMYEAATVPAAGNNLDWLYLNGSTIAPWRRVRQGSLTFIAPAAPGDYKMVFHPSNGYTVNASMNFTVGDDDGGNGGGGDDGGGGAPANLTLLAFNTWFEGTSVNNGRTYIRDIVAEINPDIVGFSEVYNYSGDWTTKIVDDLDAIGLEYYRGYASGRDVSIISKYPVVSSKALMTGSSAFEVDVDGTILTIVVSHLDYRYYACYLPRGYACGGSSPYSGWGALSGGPVTDLDIIADQNLGSNRDEQIDDILDEVGNETGPVIIMGDFNEPSHQDWTSRQANLFDHNGVVFNWTTTQTLVSNGFTDTFREVYPDEVQNPGFTWPSATNGGGSTNWIGADERDRIDYIFYRGEGMYTVDAALVGSNQYYRNGTIITDNTADEKFLAGSLSWPSDHKAVFAEVYIPGATNARVSATGDLKALGTTKGLSLEVYPNPSSGILHLLTNEKIEAVVKVINYAGQEVLRKQVNFNNAANTLDISGLNAGIYFIQLSGNGYFTTVKLIKE